MHIYIGSWPMGIPFFKRDFSDKMMKTIFLLPSTQINVFTIYIEIHSDYNFT